MMNKFESFAKNVQMEKTAKRKTVVNVEEKTNVEDSIIQQILNYKVDGDKKKLYKLDKGNQSLLEQIKPVFGITETHFVNFVIDNFFIHNPELKKLIKNNIKNL